MTQRLFFFLLLISLICFYTNTHAQALLSDSASHSIKLNLAGSLNRGNFQRLGLNNSADITFNTAKGHFGLINHTQYKYTKQFGALTENDVLSRTLFYTKLAERWYPMGVFWIETNKLRKMQPLVQGGVGMEYVWLLKKDNMGGFSVAVTYEHKRFLSNIYNKLPYNGDYKINTSRLFFRLHGTDKIGISKIALSYNLFYMPSLKYTDNYRFHGEASLNIPVTKQLSLLAGFEYNYENVVVAGVKPNDFSTNYGVTIKF